MNIEEKINNLKKYISFSEKECNFPSIFDWNWHMKLANDIETLLTAYEKEKEKNKRAEELYMQHNQMIIDILKECDYMIKNRYYMNDVAIRQHTENIKNIAKYYIKEPEWIKIKEE